MSKFSKYFTIENLFDFNLKISEIQNLNDPINAINFSKKRL